MHPEFLRGWRAADRSEHVPDAGPRDWGLLWTRRPPPVPPPEDEALSAEGLLAAGRARVAAALAAAGPGTEPLCQQLGLETSVRPMTEARARRLLRASAEVAAAARRASSLFRWAGRASPHEEDGPSEADLSEGGSLRADDGAQAP